MKTVQKNGPFKAVLTHACSHTKQSANVSVRVHMQNVRANVKVFEF